MERKHTNIKIVEKSLFETKADAYVHGCNCFCVWGAGVAKEMRRRYPEAFLADSLTKKGDRSKLGQFSLTLAYEPIIINLYSQYKYGRDKGVVYVDYDAILEGFENIKNWLIKANMGNCTIAMPFGIGSGLGGGDSTQIHSRIFYVFEGSGIEVLLCKI